MYYEPVQLGNYTPTLADVERMGIRIFDDSWSTYIPEHKQELEKKILRHYHFNQIGCDTPDRFVYYLNTQLAEIMPYYNKLYESELLKFNPLLNHSVKSSGRSIENLLTKANTTDDKFSKAIRDFVGATERAGNTSTLANTNVTGVKDFTEQTVYEKEGKDNIKGIENTTGEEHEGIKDKFDEKVTTKNDTVQNTDMTITGTDDKTVTETPKDTTTKETKWGGVVTTKTDKDEKTTSKGDGSKHYKEVLDDDSTTHTTVDLDETGSANRVQEYADTPQKQLNTENLRKDYLTNVTWNDETTKHNADTTTDTTYSDDQTKTHDETYHDTGSGSKLNDDKEVATKSGTDVETSTRGGTISTVTDDDSTSKTEGTVTTTENGTKVTDSTDQKTRNLSTKENVDTTNDKVWDENGTSTTTGHSDEKTTTAQDAKTDTTSSEQNREVANTAQSSTNNIEKTSEETTDTGTSNVTEGYMNVSASALLEAFRKTFLNIDMMIIEELKVNFMLVF